LFKLLLLSVAIAVFFIISALALAKASQAAEALTQADALPECPSSPNCISSENNAIAPIAIGNNQSEHLWRLLQQAISQQGGQLVEVRPDYLAATFKTSVFGFVDDVTARMDLTRNVIHLRSASRVGYYDFGVNRKRLLKLKLRLQNLGNDHE